MIHSEETAKKKVCPFMSSTAKTKNCIGSRCMMWTWVAESEKEKVGECTQTR